MTTPENPQQSSELVPKVYNAELVSDNDITSGDHSPGPMLRRVAGECTGYVVRRVRESEWVARLRSVAAYRMRKVPRDLARLVWFVLRGHGRWIAKGWTWATHGDLRTDVRTARLTGDAQARRQAQEAIRADAKARWAKLGIALRRMAISSAGVLFVVVVLALAEKVFDRAAMPEWLVTSTRCVIFWARWSRSGGRGCSRSGRSAGSWRRCGKAGTAPRVRGG
jgi:DNA segregation ATPase FtsK/SpoIIIE, S-DNA-T family